MSWKMLSAYKYTVGILHKEENIHLIGSEGEMKFYYYTGELFVRHVISKV